MAVLGKNKIINLVEKYKMVYPFDLQLLDGDSYVLTVKRDTKIPYLSHKNISSYEIVFTPPQYVGRLSVKSKYGRSGLFFSGAVNVHSGWTGRVVLELLNANDEHRPITVKRGDPFIHLNILERKGEPSPYSGQYQFQDMSEEEIRMYKPFMEKAWKDAGLKVEGLREVADKILREKEKE